MKESLNSWLHCFLFISFHCRNFAVLNSSIVIVRYCCELVVIKEQFCNATCMSSTYKSNKSF
jgi:hypothetical protein